MKKKKKNYYRKFSPQIVERKRKDGKTYISHDIYPEILTAKSSYENIDKTIERVKKVSRVVNKYPFERDISLSQVTYLENNILWALKGKKKTTKLERAQMKFIIVLIGLLRDRYFHFFGHVPYFFISDQEVLNSTIKMNNARFREMATKNEK